jgi:hypothetical protein
MKDPTDPHARMAQKYGDLLFWLMVALFLSWLIAERFRHRMPAILSRALWWQSGGHPEMGPYYIFTPFLIFITLGCLWIFWIEMTKPPTNKPKPRLSARDYLEMLVVGLLTIGAIAGVYILGALTMRKFFDPALYKYDPNPFAPAAAGIPVLRTVPITRRG